MVIIILCGATCFTGVFLGIGGGDVVTDFVMGLGLGKWGTFRVMMAIVFLLGMFIDWIVIVLICFPLFLPIAKGIRFRPDLVCHHDGGESPVAAFFFPLFSNRAVYQQSIFGRFLPLRRSGSGIERSPHMIHRLVSTGSITSSISRVAAMLIAFPCS